MRPVLAALIGVLLGAFFVPAAQAQAFLRNDRFDADIRRAVTAFVHLHSGCY